MKVHKVTLYIVDFDQVGADDVKTLIENARYPNPCISPLVLDVKTAEIGEWDDSHPLNHSDKAAAAIKSIFPA